jgi:DNA-binding NarL/FixJ family response regulator
MLLEEDVLLVDIASYTTRYSNANFKVMVLDNRPTFVRCLELMQEGVKAYGNVYMHPTHILSAIESLKEEKIWIYPDFLALLIGSNKEKSTKDIDEKLDSLSHREAEIAKLILDGLTNKEIASTLDIAVNTIKNHTKNIYAKLNVTDRLSLFSFLK